MQWRSDHVDGTSRPGGDELPPWARLPRGARELRETARPIFVVGAARVGSSLLEAMLATHPAGVTPVGETPALAAALLRHLAPLFACCGDLNETTASGDEDAAADEDLGDDVDGEPGGRAGARRRRACASRALSALTPHALDAAAAQYLRTIDDEVAATGRAAAAGHTDGGGDADASAAEDAAADDDAFDDAGAAAAGAAAAAAVRFVDKNLYNWRFMPLIAALFPRARVVRVTRHPLDAALSVFFEFFAVHCEHGAYDLAAISRTARAEAAAAATWRRSAAATAAAAGGALDRGDLYLEVPLEGACEGVRLVARRNAESRGRTNHPPRRGASRDEMRNHATG